MSKIYLSGDFHGDFRRLGSKVWKEGRDLTKDDFVIGLGDFGGVWEVNEDSKRWEEEQYWLDWLSDKKWTTLFVEGNHENSYRLEKFPIIEKFGGRVSQISESIFWLRRGEIYTIADKKFFTFGGAMSIDKIYRKENISWWPQEQPNKKEQDYGIDNLINHDMKVDYILTHTCPQHIVSILLGGAPTSPYSGNYYDKFYDPLTKYFSYINDSVQFDKWFFGHFHEDKEIDDKFMCLYKGIYRLI